ncbi:MAG: tRNA preQ1(34) S-adenosylmethionine ribosyltransferase-isomerase QueA [Bacteroidetes bacterium]|mgnify:FL=1|jgi:S-adenosylmethionine:tRNA ribosyltransferase-isomerase|nr:tRNA preQ1(34) S-adenosylmethionine ribosyltransferase-isomerase QueA [Bacteroidota bacterium]MCO5248392.1 tRNA preQ1(34) S-adenosylmethionine ribosyltransferase-isomerase QueA [Chitinophagales bacterium]MCO5277985.1 tRNA preQ1(34) S-adenosylmethionine ribosyltransferase-isomerase QueA [Saprospiraceae bacterium]HQU94715.1 tRNA preQ1(34) S-adenosylmethionine ribosyltransferase-isomerase QueA [Saprospiraceae bacterium]HQW96058.1 tRNA preQ1(34) S-adenosylmethionine ribosyltransferase-isomerase 
MRYKLSNFNFDLPKNKIAQFPSEQRELAKLMVVHKDTGKIEHKVFKDILDYFDAGDVMIRNDTKVFPARLYGKKEKTGATIEVFLLRELNSEMKLWDVLVDPARKIRVGNKLYFNDAKGNEVLVAEVVDNTTSRGRTIRFFYDGDSEAFMKILDQLGNTPLPKYINRNANDLDKERYQTVYAKSIGAVAAPTAGLHFSKDLLKRLEIKGVDFAELTLHIGLGTFRSIDVEDLSKHKMEAEYFKISDIAADKVNKAKLEKHRVCAIGTTSMRSIESAVSAEGMLKAAEGWTNKFIFPPYPFSIADSMLTNFHLPKSSLIIMICAFGGYELIMDAYQEAIKNDYNFYSYGDAMLII